jgi:tetratricopeptide (TPR) repeat protein
VNGHPTEWLPGLVALAAGLLIGFFLLRRSLGQRGASAPAVPVAAAPRREAEARYAALCAQLRDLEDNASQLEPEPLARERYRLECAAGAALLELEAAPAAGPAPATPAAEASAAPAGEAGAAPVPANPALRGFLWGAGGVAALAVLGLFVSREATVRREGGSITGNIPGEERGAVPDEVARLQARVGARPDDLEARLELAFAHLQRRELMAVFEHTQYVLERRPRDVRALSYQALVRLAMNQAAEAEAMLQTALAEDPDSLDARLHLGLVYMQQGRMAEAEAALQEAIRRHPDQREALEGLLAEMKERAAQAPPPAAGEAGDPHAGVPPPPVAASPASVPADGVGVTIRLSPGVDPRGVLFVMVREAGQAAGPPIAARRLGGSFPATVVITAADSMMGQPLPESLSLEARLDRDGDVTTRESDEPVARRDGVARGSRDTVLELKKP